MYSFSLLKNLVFLEACILLGYGLFYLCLSRRAQLELGHRPLIVFAGVSAICFLSPGIWAANFLLFLFPFVLGKARVNAGIVAALGLISIPLISTQLSIGGVPLISYSFHNSIVLGSLCALLSSRGGPAKHPFWTNIPLIIIIVLMAIVTARGTTFTNGLRQLTVMAMTYGIPVFVISKSLKTLEDVKIFLLSLAAAGAMLAVILIYETRGHWPLYSILDGRYGMFQQGVIAKFRGFFMRAYGPLGEATNMGFVLVICFAAALACRRSFKSSLAAIALPLIIAIGLAGPQSRGAFMGVAIVFVVTVAYREGARSFSKLSSAAVLLAIAALGGSVFDLVMGGKFSAGMNQAGDTVDYRARLFDRGMEEFYKHPILGDSYISVVSRMSDMIQGEGIVDFVNSYLYFALFTGFFGFLIFALNFLYCSYCIIQKRSNIRLKSKELDMAAFGISVIVAAMVMLIFCPFMDRLATLTMVALQIGLTAAAELYRAPSRVPKVAGEPSAIAEAPVAHHRLSPQSL